jgi:tripartite-type tricarboxylate transporter receptor subunit TctC
MRLSLLVLLSSLLFASNVFGQAWPAKPVRLIVPFAPGGGVDITARTVAPVLSSRLGQQIIVDNRGGAGGNIGAEAAARATPDGYTLLMASSAQMAINPHMYAKLPFDPVRDFVPITLMGQAVNAVCVHPSLPARSIKELIALAKSQPMKLTFASGGIGASDHIATELFMSMTGVRMVHVPYKGGAPAMVDLLGGNVDLGFSTVATAMGAIRAGRVRALGVTSAKRFELLPDVPTIAEAGVPGYEAVSWYGLFALAGTPAAIVTRANSEMVAILDMPDVRKRLMESGVIPVSSTPDAFAAYIRNDSARWGKLIRANAIKAE